MNNPYSLAVCAPQTLSTEVSNLPQILKNYSKEVIRHGPEDVIKFSKVYFETILK